MKFQIEFKKYIFQRELQVDVPKSNIATIWTPILQWCVVRCGSKYALQEDVFKNEIGVTGPKDVDYSKFDNQHDWGDPYDHFNMNKNLHFDNE